MSDSRREQYLKEFAEQALDFAKSTAHSISFRYNTDMQVAAESHPVRSVSDLLAEIDIPLVETINLFGGWCAYQRLWNLQISINSENPALSRSEPQVPLHENGFRVAAAVFAQNGFQVARTRLVYQPAEDINFLFLKNNLLWTIARYSESPFNTMWSPRITLGLG